MVLDHERAGALPRTFPKTGTRPERVGHTVVAGVELCRAAARWRRLAECTLAPAGLTHTQFLVLWCTDSLISLTADAATQTEVAAFAGVDRTTTSEAMRALEQAGLVDRGPSASGVALRVILTDRGKCALRSCQQRLEAMCGPFFRSIEPSRFTEILEALGSPR